MVQEKEKRVRGPYVDVLLKDKTTGETIMFEKAWRFDVTTISPDIINIFVGTDVEAKKFDGTKYDAYVSMHVAKKFEEPVQN